MEFFVTTGPQQTAGQAMVVEAMSGDRAAMDALWHEHRRWIAAVLLAHKSPEDQVEDLLQEVAMTIVAKINTLREARYVRAWLRTVAINTARASARARRARPKLTPLAVDPLGPDAAGVAVDDEARRLMKLSERLADTYREPLMLRALHGMRGRHIAEILDLSEATVETRIARARRMLRELATGTGTDDDERAPVVAATGM
jgi:RNA polymerase sigma-70 factor (ECF subfamily)